MSAKSELRTLLVTRRYWPHVGDDAACRLAMLADGLHRGGLSPEIVAARYAASWPKELTVHELPLHRPAPAPRSDWSMVRYTRALNNWLRDQAVDFQLLYADAMREEGALVVETARRLGVPSVVRYGGIGEDSDAVWWNKSRAGRRCKAACLKATAIIAVRASAMQELLSQGVPQERIHRIDNGFVPGPSREEGARIAARMALANINGDLFVPVDGRVLLTTNSMHDSGGLMTLLQALPELLDRTPGLRVWMANDGPQRDKLYNFVRQMGIRSQVAMPGSFAAFDELLLAADLYVHPSPNDGLEYFLPRVIGAGVPTAVADTVEIRRLFGESLQHLTTFQTDSPASLTSAIESMLETFIARQDAARRARQAALQRSFTDCVQQHVRLFCRLTGQSISGTPATTELTS